MIINTMYNIFTVGHYANGLLISCISIQLSYSILYFGKYGGRAQSIWRLLVAVAHHMATPRNSWWSNISCILAIPYMTTKRSVLETFDYRFITWARHVHERHVNTVSVLRLAANQSWHFRNYLAHLRRWMPKLEFTYYWICNKRLLHFGR